MLPIYITMQYKKYAGWSRVGIFYVLLEYKGIIDTHPKCLIQANTNNMFWDNL